MLLTIAATWPPRVTHAVARLLGWTAALGMFCGGECCPSCGIWDEDGEGR